MPTSPRIEAEFTLGPSCEVASSQDILVFLDVLCSVRVRVGSSHQHFPELVTVSPTHFLSKHIGPPGDHSFYGTQHGILALS